LGLPELTFSKFGKAEYCQWSRFFILFSKYNAIKLTHEEKPEIHAPLPDATMIFVQKMRHQVSKKEFFFNSSDSRVLVAAF